MNLSYILQLIYSNRREIKKAGVVILVLVLGFILFIYLVIATVFTVIQGQGTVVSDDIAQPPGTFTEFQSFSYKTVFGEKWYAFAHPYIFPTLGVLTQGVILDEGAVVGTRHIAWDIADRVSRQTEVKAFADGTVVAVKNNTLYNTTRRWKFCDTSDTGICWYEVAESADVQYGYGNEIDIQHPDSLRTQYCHLASVDVQVDDQVTIGQVIGYQGSTGWATGKHLHFALWRAGQPIPPTYAFTQTSLENWGDDGN
jgi:murein DD-endopeptidase MepM/ murein hydrolase activator NlpD